MKTHTKTPLCCPRCWKPLACVCAQEIYLDDVGTQFGKKGGMMRAKHMSETRRKEIARLGGLKKQENFRKKKTTLSDSTDTATESHNDDS